MSPCHSIWLMPCEEDHVLLSRTVERLAGQFGTERFSPHLTLVEDMARQADELSALLERDFANIPAFACPVAAVRGLPLFYRSLFAAFEPVGPLHALKETAVATFGVGDLAGFMPHVSLAYGVAEDSKPAAIRTLDAEFAGRVIRFDSIVVATSGQDVPIAQWGIAARLRLR